MAVADRTYSFRASSSLGKRLSAAQRDYARLAQDPQLAHHISRELEVALLRQFREGEEASHGAFIRSVVDAFVCAVEGAVADERIGPELSDFDRADAAGHEERAAFLAASAAQLPE